MVTSSISRAIAAGWLIFLAACSGGYSSEPKPAAVASLGAAPTALVLLVGQTKQLTPRVQDASGNILTGRVVTWTTDSPAVLSVSENGLVTAKGLGYATIFVSCEGKTFSLAATVSAE